MYIKLRKSRILFKIEAFKTLFFEDLGKNISFPTYLEKLTEFIKKGIKE